jgi:hypothetical protein
MNACNMLDVFGPGRPFQPSLLLKGKGRSQSLSEALHWEYKHSYLQTFDWS